jgi:Leucine-rich repeat (LRR) protein
LTSLSLVGLGIGSNIEVRGQLSDLVLYNENIQKLNLRGNNLIKIKPFIQNLVRNCNSNIQKLVLSENDYEMFDFNEFLNMIEKESVLCQRHHFKLRFVCFSNCPNLYPFEFKIKKKLDEFYQVRRKVFI